MVYISIQEVLVILQVVWKKVHIFLSNSIFTGVNKGIKQWSKVFKVNLYSQGQLPS